MATSATLLDLRNIEAGREEVVANVTSNGITAIGEMTEVDSITALEEVAAREPESEKAAGEVVDPEGVMVEMLYTGEAADQVFSIPELLENILGRVSQIDVFVLQRVNTTFNNTTLGSSKLQKKMLSSQVNLLLDNEANLTERTITTHRLGWPKCRAVENAWIGDWYGYAYSDDSSMLDEIRCFQSRDKLQTLGWQGQRAVYATGSWGKIELSPEGCAVDMWFYNSIHKTCTHMGPGGHWRICSPCWKEVERKWVRGTRRRRKCGPMSGKLRLLRKCGLPDRDRRRLAARASARSNESAY